MNCFWGQQSRNPVSCQQLCKAATLLPLHFLLPPSPSPLKLVSSMAFRRQVKNFVKNYSEAEVKVREATSNDPWGPSSSLMLDISDLTFNTVSLSEIMNMLWQRLNDHGKNWRHVYKSLTLMDYLIKNGSKKVIQLCREGFFNIQTLKDFHHIDEAGKDQGYYIREKSKQIITLLMDEQLLHKEREVACWTRRRTSYSMTFPKRLPGAGHSPTHLPSPNMASDPPASENTRKLLKISRLHLTNIVPSPLEKSPSLHTNLSLGKRLDSFGFDRFDLSSFALENTMQQSLECHPPQKNCDTLGTMQSPWPPGREEVANTNIRVSKSDPFFQRSQAFPHRSQASVETLYMSPSLKESLISKEYPKPTQSTSKEFSETPLPNLSSNIVKTDSTGFNPFGRHDSTVSEGTSSSFSTFFISSPDLAIPENIPHVLGLSSNGSSLRPSSHGPSSSSMLFKEIQVRVNHPFDPCLPSSDEDESDSINLLDILPDNSDSANPVTSDRIFPVQDIQCLVPASDPAPQMGKGLPESAGPNTPILGALGEIKHAIRRLHGDLSKVVHELRIVNSHLISMEARNSQQAPLPVSKALSPGASVDSLSQF
ncbi:ENTH domain-containing protein 1 isoform X2 [Sarcophilus harrisii]|uniref:ENTH domain-containing protein 1 isoform X2 n=1 Tax=Sarcophilus harrisii TaxID=9305 RepID=UPI001301E9FE|nr:ENTH domain-containing protein 1 isoform X2 [Sarcophilus harrisii]